MQWGLRHTRPGVLLHSDWLGQNNNNLYILPVPVRGLPDSLQVRNSDPLFMDEETMACGDDLDLWPWKR